MANNQNNNQQSKRVPTITSNNCGGIEPSFIGYRLLSSDIENFVKTYLEENQIDGLLSPAVVISREGNNSSISVAFYIFLKTNSSDAITNRGTTIPSHLQKKLGATRFKASEKLKRALRPLVPFKDGQPDSRLSMHDKGKQSVLYVKCDIFKVLALMLDAPRNQFDVAITEAISLKKGRSYITAVKGTKFNEGGNDGDALHNIAMNLEARR